MEDKKILILNKEEEKFRKKMIQYLEEYIYENTISLNAMLKITPNTKNDHLSLKKEELQFFKEKTLLFFERKNNDLLKIDCYLLDFFKIVIFKEKYDFIFSLKKENINEELFYLLGKEFFEKMQLLELWSGVVFEKIY